MSWKRFVPVSSFALLCLLGVVSLHLFEPFAYMRTRNLLRDAFSRSGRKTPPNPDLVFLAIDSESVSLDELDLGELYGLTNSDSTEATALRLMSSRWPWPREVYAMVLDRLVAAGATAVLFDLNFPTSTEGDEPFRLALERDRDRVVIGSNFVAASLHGLTRSAPSLTRPVESLIPQTTPMDDRVAYTNFWPDEDDIVRRAQYRVTFEQIDGHMPAPEAERFLSLAARGLVKAGFADRIPSGDDEQIFRYTAPPREGFPPHSLFEIFVPEYWQRNYRAGEFFRGKIVLIGAEGNWQHDEHATPFGSMPGPELHLNALNAALHGEFIHEMSPAAVALVSLIAAVFAIWLSLTVRSPWLRLLVLLAADALDVGITLQAFNRLSLYIPCLPPLLVLNSTVLLGLVCDFAFERLEKARIRGTLERYVSTNVVRELLDNPQLFQQSLGGVIKPVAILFSDLRGFSSISARTDPHALVSQLNEYLSAMVECVFRYGGTLDKFIGDAVMAVWGNVKSAGVRDDTTNAVRAALEMRTELARLNLDWRKRGLPELRFGIAVNQGEVVVGNIGSPRRMEFGVVGDVVNVSWRLQELTKDLGCDLIVSKNVRALLVEEFDLESRGSALLVGQSEPVEVFAVLGAAEVPASF